ncbi:MAG: heterodisulfide reductase-related iron-sulfur binding cluster [Anaerolineales bacterium]|jgi:Fe-S oxidoreductase
MTTEAIPSAGPQPDNERWTKLKTGFVQALPRVRDFFVHSVLQTRVLKKAYPGIMHALIFWGVTIQVLGTLINLQQMALFLPFIELPFPRGNLYLAFELVMDLAGVAIILGVSMALFRRIVLKPKNLETRWDDSYALVLLMLIPIVGFTLEGTRLLSAAPEWSNWSPIGAMVAGLMGSMGMSTEGAMNLHFYLFWTHAALGLTLVASIPFTKLRHLVMVPLNVILHPRRKEGTLELIDDIEEVETLGVGQVQEFASHQLLSFDACVSCGRCDDVCPAAISGMPYSPRTFIRSLREVMITNLVKTNGSNGKNGQELAEVLPEDIAWSCTTCGACLTRCPAFVNPVDEVIDLRRYQVLTSGKMPKSVGDTIRNMERQGNPWGMPAEDRLAWADGLEIRELSPGDETDVLLFLGCAFAYDDRNKKVAQSFVRLLQKAGVDFGILGYDEICCGETARRLGNEYLFQEFAKQNIEVLSKVKFNRVVTQCPHCFNTLKNEYPQIGGNFKVQHYTEFLNELSFQWEGAGKNGNSLKGNLTYHDSCYLGRYNEIYKEPRGLLDKANVSRVEMALREENAFCCGGGGGQMWLETDANTRINHRRLDNVLEAKADVVATACPYCLLMFDDAIRSKGLGDQVQVMDVAEVLAKQLEV